MPHRARNLEGAPIQSEGSEYDGAWKTLQAAKRNIDIFTGTVTGDNVIRGPICARTQNDVTKKSEIYGKLKFSGM